MPSCKASFFLPLRRVYRFLRPGLLPLAPEISDPRTGQRIGRLEFPPHFAVSEALICCPEAIGPSVLFRPRLLLRCVVKKKFHAVTECPRGAKIVATLR